MKKAEINWRGGNILSLEEELDTNESMDSQINILREDLIAVEYGDSVILDLGWFPEFNPTGQFVLSVVKIKKPKNPKGEDWETPIFQLKFRDLKELMSNLNQAIEVARDLASKQ